MPNEEKKQKIQDGAQLKRRKMKRVRKQILKLFLAFFVVGAICASMSLSTFLIILKKRQMVEFNYERNPIEGIKRIWIRFFFVQN